MPGVRAAVLGVLLMLVAHESGAAGQQQPAPVPPPTAPGQPPPGQPGTLGQPGTPGQPGPVTQPAPATQPALPRTFTAPAGVLFNTVRADRVADFEKVMGYLQAALASSASESVRAQARGWRVFKAAEPGPSGTVLYVFVLDPTMPGADYGLGRILADAYPDQAQLQEIWKLYNGAVTGGSLLNLTPVEAPAPKPPAPLP
jgi:hypothetical protein